MKEEILLEKIQNLKKLNEDVPELIRKINHLEFPLNMGNKHYDNNMIKRLQMLKDLRDELSQIRGE